MSSVINTIPNFRPIIYNSEFLSLDEVRDIIIEKGKIIDSYIHLCYILYNDDYDLYDDNAVIQIHENALNAKIDISYLKDQLRCWDLKNN